MKGMGDEILSPNLFETGFDKNIFFENGTHIVTKASKIF